MKLIVLKIKGMHSVLDVTSIERIVKSVAGVDAADIDIVTARAKIRTADDTDAELLKAAVDRCGYEASFDDIEETGKEEILEKSRKNIFLYASVCVVAVVLNVVMFLMSKNFIAYKYDAVTFISVALFLLTLPLIIKMRGFITNGLKDLLYGEPRMYSVIAVACSTAFLYSLFSMANIISGKREFVSGLYFAPICLILFFAYLGEYFKDRIALINDNCCGMEKNECPVKVMLCKNDCTVEVSEDMIFPKDIIFFDSESKIVGDGIVVSGEAVVDESGVNGVSRPVNKSRGSKVFAGSFVINGELYVKIDDIPRSASSKKSNAYINLSDLFSEQKKAAIFIPVIAVITVLTAINWLFYTGNLNFAVNTGLAVLLLASPCFLYIAATVPFLNAAKSGAKKGIIYKSAQAIINAGKISSVLLSKTGTLTKNKFICTHIKTFNGVNEKAAVCLAASLVQNSIHPFSECFRELVSAEDLIECSKVKEDIGKGISALCQNTRIFLGTDEFIKDKCLINGEVRREAELLGSEGNFIVYLAAGRHICALFAVAEEMFEEDSLALKAINDSGLRTIMISGDNSQAGERVAKNLAIQKYIADLSAADKYQLIRSMQQAGEYVALVSNNNCDRKLQSCADISISLGDRLNENANITFLQRDLSLILQTIKISEYMMQKIKSNVKISILLNFLFIPFACGALYYYSGTYLDSLYVTLIILLNAVIISILLL